MKKGRHEAIIELIKKYEIENQNELASKLSEAGYDVTQATVSRDIQKLDLIKVKKNGKFRYAIVENPDVFSEKYVRIIKETVKNIDTAKNLVVLKTQPGMAMAAAAAIEGLKFGEIVGSIAGDDGVFFATKNDDNAILLQSKLEVVMRKE